MTSLFLKKCHKAKQIAARARYCHYEPGYVRNPVFRERLNLYRDEELDDYYLDVIIDRIELEEAELANVIIDKTEQDHICWNVLGIDDDYKFKCSKEEFEDDKNYHGSLMFEKIDTDFQGHVSDRMADAFLHTGGYFSRGNSHYYRNIYNEKGEEESVIESASFLYWTYQKLLGLYLEEDVCSGERMERRRDIHDFLWSWEWYRWVMIKETGVDRPYQYEPFFFIPYSWLYENARIFKDSGCIDRKRKWDNIS